MARWWLRLFSAFAFYRHHFSLELTIKAPADVSVNTSSFSAVVVVV